MNEKATIFDYVRMCKNMKKCEDCPLCFENKGKEIDCGALVLKHTDKANEIILNWCKEHPVETRQDRFLKMFPNAKTNNDGVIELAPCTIEKDRYINVGSCSLAYGFESCDECRKNFWLAEVDENE